jgi:cell division protease FtsH
VQQLARQALEQAVELLQQRRPLLDELVNLLIERETIDGTTFSAIVERYEQAAGAVVVPADPALAVQAGA